MFGANAFGQPYYGQITAMGAARLGASAVVTVATAASLTAPVQLVAASVLSVGSDATLTVQGPLLADATLSVGTAPGLGLRAVLAATPGLQWETVGKVIVPGTLETSATVAVTVAAPRLNVGSVTVAATAALAIGVTPPRLSTLPADFRATTGLRVGTTASLGQTGVGVSEVIIAIGGAVTSRVRLGSIVIDDVLNEAPNTCEFVMDEQPPPVGTDVKIGLQNLLIPNLLFAGTVKSRQQFYEPRVTHPVWSIRCDDYTFLLNRRQVFGTYTNVSASTVATDLVTKYTNGFSASGIVAGLPPVTVTFSGQTVMDALTTVASLIGGYTKVDYGKVVSLFVTPTLAPPTDLVPGNRLLMHDPPVRVDTDATQTRTRVFVVGTAAAVVGPPDALIYGATPVPLAESAMFVGGSQVLADDGQILSYTGTTPGGQSAVVVGNVAGPSSGGTPALAVGVAGRLSGTYQWAIAYANSAGETVVGPKSAALFCPDVTSPTNAPGLGASGAIGPLVGAYDYRVSYLTTLGETLPGPSAHRQAVAIAPPSTSVGSTPGLCRLSPGVYKWLVTYVTAYGETGPGAIATGTQSDITTALAPSVANANGAGPLAPGAPYAYRSTFLTQDGESAPGGVTTFTPSALSLPGVGSFTPNGFGGVLGGAYYYGITFVTYLGESGMNVQYAGTNFAGPYPGWAPAWSGAQDQNGRIERGYTYIWVASYYSDIYGESPFGPGTSQFVGGSVPVRLGINISNFRPTGADGVRIYRAIQGVGGYLLNKEFRFATGVPTSYWDDISQGECGSNYPIQTLRAGVAMNVTMYPTTEVGVTARRLYRTKAGGAEYFLVAEIQSNAQATITDTFADNQLAQRNPVPTTGRIGLVSVPTGPTGALARRVYRSKRDLTSALFFLGEIRDNTTPSLVDTIPDDALTSSMPTANTGGSNSVPVIAVPTGPSGVLKRRIYRTRANGSTYALLAELGDNVTTSYTDNTPDDALSGGTPPGISDAGGEAILVTSIPIGPTGTLARLLYRTRAGGGEYGEVTRISDNSTTTYLDTVPDTSLGGGVSLVNEAGSSAVNLTNIPIGPASVTQRILYRTLAGGADLHYVGTLDDNTTTSFLDTRADTQLGRTPQATSTIGALVGDTTLVLDSGATAFPADGWIRADNQFVRYSSKSGTTLTGIPASGAGAIVAAIRGGSAVLTVPMLTGVSGLMVALPVGSRLALFVTVNSAAGQAALAAAEGGDGVHEFTVVDTSLETVAACTARGNAELLLFQYVQLSLEYASRDRLTQSGATITVNLPAPLGITGSFMIQTVRIDEIDIAPRTFPRYTVRASSTKFSLSDLLRHVVLSTTAVA